jgi:hypothetical protein
LKLVSILLSFVALSALGTLAASAQTYDESAAIVAPAADLSLRSHDDWPLANAPATSSLDLSQRSHDDWALGAL